MTKNEAVDRAKAIWGKVDEVSLVPRTGEAWVLKGGKHHHIDGNGHATCHPECSKLEAAIPPV